MDQCWSEAFEQVWTLTWVPLVVEPLGSVRHRPWKASTYSPLEFRDHSWFRWPLQASITSLVPVPPQVLSVALPHDLEFTVLLGPPLARAADALPDVDRVAVRAEPVVVVEAQVPESLQGPDGFHHAPVAAVGECVVVVQRLHGECAGGQCHGVDVYVSGYRVAPGAFVPDLATEWVTGIPPSGYREWVSDRLGIFVAADDGETVVLVLHDVLTAAAARVEDVGQVGVRLIGVGVPGAVVPRAAGTARGVKPIRAGPGLRGDHDLGVGQIGDAFDAGEGVGLRG